MRPARVPLLLLLLCALSFAATACSRDRTASLPRPKPGFCEAAARYDRQIEVGAGLDEQIRILEKMDRNAPKDAARDTAAFLDALRRLRDGDDSVVDDPDIERAVEHVNRRAATGCRFFEKEPGSGV